MRLVEADIAACVDVEVLGQTLADAEANTGAANEGADAAGREPTIDVERNRREFRSCAGMGASRDADLSAQRTRLIEKIGSGIGADAGHFGKCVVDSNRALDVVRPPDQRGVLGVLDSSRDGGGEADPIAQSLLPADARLVAAVIAEQGVVVAIVVERTTQGNLVRLVKRVAEAAAGIYGAAVVAGQNEAGILEFRAQKGLAAIAGVDAEGEPVGCLIAVAERYSVVVDVPAAAATKPLDIAAGGQTRGILVARGGYGRFRRNGVAGRRLLGRIGQIDVVVILHRAVELGRELQGDCRGLPGHGEEAHGGKS